MALVGMAGFDRPEMIALRVSGGESLPVSPRAGARGSALRIPAGSAARARIALAAATAATDGLWAHFGFWYRNGTPGTATHFVYLMTSYSSPTGGVTLYVRTDGLLDIRSNVSTVLATTTQTVGDGNWHHIHVTARLSTVATTGRLKVWIDGAPSIDVTKATLVHTNHRGISSLDMVVGTSTATAEFDDVWLDDDNTEWFAPKVLTVATLAPDGPGASTAWTPTPAGQPNWQIAGDSVDDTYVSSQTVGARDLYTFADLPAGATTVEAVSLHTRGQQVGAGAPLVKPLHRHSNGTITAGGGIAQGASMGNNVPQTWTVNPATGLAWTVADVNGAQFGIELSS